MQAARIYGVLSAGVIAFQLGLALGMPWGALAMGGAYPGTYPPEMRVVAVAAALLLAGFAGLVLLAARGTVARAWLWPLAGLLGLGLALNLISPSAGERALWAPVVAVMLACTVRVAWGKAVA